MPALSPITTVASVAAVRTAATPGTTRPRLRSSSRTARRRASGRRGTHVPRHATTRCSDSATPATSRTMPASAMSTNSGRAYGDAGSPACQRATDAACAARPTSNAPTPSHGNTAGGIVTSADRTASRASTFVTVRAGFQAAATAAHTPTPAATRVGSHATWKPQTDAVSVSRSHQAIPIPHKTPRPAPAAAPPPPSNSACPRTILRSTRASAPTAPSSPSWCSCAERSAGWRWRTRSCAGRLPTSPRRRSQNELPAGP